MSVPAHTHNLSDIVDVGALAYRSTVGAGQIAPSGVTLSRLQNLAASVLLGRGNGGAGDPQEITLGTNLSMSGTTLNAEGGGGGVPTSRLINTTAPLAGGGDLSADRTLTINDATTTTKGAVELATSGENAPNVVVQGNDARLSDARAPLTHTHPRSEITNLTTDLVAINTDIGNLELGKADIVHQHTASDVTDFTEAAQDAVGAMAETTSLEYDDAGPVFRVKRQMSIVSHASGLKLDGDAASPGNSKLYGTDGSGVKGWYSQPVGGAGVDPPEGSYAPGSYTIATGKFRNAVKNQQFTTTQRLTVQGTARLSIYN